MDKLDNSSSQWDRIWTNKLTSCYLYFPASRTIETFVRKQLYFKAIDKLLDSFSFENKDILELGSGTGNNSLYLAKLHKVKSVTLLDFSGKALERAIIDDYPCPVKKIQEDILESSLMEGYDFVHSTGLIEHFSGTDRFLIVKKHAQFAKPGGLVMIWVPISSLAFKPIKKFNQCVGIKEKPFTKDELQYLCKASDLKILKEGETVFGALYGILAEREY